MKTILILFFLTTQSSYQNDVEQPATAQVFDTVQFAQHGGHEWRIRTYAQDQDLHIHRMGEPKGDLASFAQRHVEKVYGDVLGKRFVIESDSGIDGVREQLRRQGLPDHLEVTPYGAIFWTPPNTDYQTRSTPPPPRSK